MAASGDLYTLGRGLNDYVTALLSAPRATGDLKFLDEVDRLLEIARGRLADANGDGFLDWRWLHDPSIWRWRASGKWGSVATMARYASAWRDRVWNNGTSSMAERVDGSGTWPKGFAMYNSASLARWDSTGTIAALAERHYTSAPANAYRRRCDRREEAE
jgi:hypothetical protein